VKDTIRNLGLSALLACAGTVWAQQPSPANAPAKPAQPTAQSEAGEPRANTSEAPDAAGAQPTEAARAPSTVRSTAAATAPGATAPGATAPVGKTPAGQKPANAKSTATDRLQLGTATVTGDREQPKVMYVVPWKKPDIGDAQGKPMNSLVDEILSPVDRDVFKREVRYYQTVNSEAGQNGASAGAPPPAGQVEK
jgi:hypothetical protein